MSKISTARGAHAAEGYVVEEIERRRAQAGTRGFPLRSEKAIAYAETIEEATDKPVTALIELLVQRAIDPPSTPERAAELDALIASESEKVGQDLSESLADFVVVMAKRSAKAAEERSVPTVRMGPGGPLPAMHYVGVWKDGESYVPGDVATHAGTSWHCGLPTRSKPGTNHSWQMMGKSEKAAR